MPLLKVQTNQTVEAGRRTELLGELTAVIAETLGKPPGYVQVVLETGVPMAFGGTTEPTALAELRSLGLPDAAPRALSARLGAVLERALGVPTARMFLVCADHPRAHWGWNGDTFG